MSEKEYLIRPLGNMNLNKLADYLERNYPMNQEIGNFDFICKTKLKDGITVGKHTFKADDTFLIVNSENGEPPKFGLLQKWNADVIPLDNVVDIIEEQSKRYVDFFQDAPLQVHGRVYMTNLNPEVQKDDFLPNEWINRSIVESVVEDHQENLDDWSLSESGGLIVLEMDGEEKSYASFKEVLKDIGESIEEDLYNHQDYLTEEQLLYLKNQGFDVPEYETIDIQNSKERDISVNDSIKKQVQTTADSQEPLQSKNKEQGSSKKWNWKELAKQIENQISITDVVRNAGYNLKKNGTTSYTTEEHNSLVLDLKTNRFYWNSRPPRPEDVERAQKQIEKTGKGHIPQCLSGGVITFYMIARNVAYREAVQQLAKQINLSVEIPEKVKRSVDTDHKKMTPIERHKFLQSQLLKNKYQNQDMKNVKAYLIKTRKIDPEIVDLFIQRNMLFQTQDKEGRTQAAFIGKDENGYLSYVNFRSTSSVSKFKGDYSGCDYDRGCFFEPEFDIPLGWKDDPQRQPINKDKRLLVFESNIEMLSYMTLLKLNGNNYKNFAYLSCGSISKSSCVLETCKAYGYDKVIVMFNNDRDKKNNPGLTKANFVANQLQKEGIDAHPLVPSKCNDWNDTLVAYKEKKIELQKFKQPAKKEPKKSIGIAR